MRTPRSSRLARGAAALAVFVLPVAGCAGSDGAETTPTPTATAALTLSDGWVKAVDSGMTAAFGVLENSSDPAVTVVSATTEAAGMVELHETVEGASGEMVMQPVAGGFEVPAGGTHELAPGGDHIMLMDVTEPIEPGEPVTIVLVTDDGGSLTVVLPARSFSGADESYQSREMGEMGDASTPTP